MSTVRNGHRAGDVVEPDDARVAELVDSCGFLSDVLSVMRTGRPVAHREVWRAPWALRYTPVPGAAG